MAYTNPFDKSKGGRDPQTQEEVAAAQQWAQQEVADKRAASDEAMRRAGKDPNDPEHQAYYDEEMRRAGHSYMGAAVPAEYGGIGGVDLYREAARDGVRSNDAQQAIAQGGLASAYAAMTGNRGPMAVENSVLAGREAGIRNDQMGALSLLRDQAMGRAPSEAAYQTRLGLQDVQSGFTGQMGQARGLAGLTGAQAGGAAAAGVASGNVAAAGGIARGNEIANAIGQYGKTAGQVAGQDLTRLGMGNQMSQFNAGLNNDWKLGNANLAAGWANLGNQQDATDQGWFAESMKPGDIQFQLDQEAQGWKAQSETDRVQTEYSKDLEKRQNTAAIAGGIAQAGLTAVGSLAGPAGAALGGMAGSAINSATKKYY